MGRIRTELGLDGALTLAQAVRAAQEALGLAPEGTLAAQVEALTRTLIPWLSLTLARRAGGGANPNPNPEPKPNPCSPRRWRP